MGGQLVCVNHLDKGAGFYCAPCQLYFCADCAKHIWVRNSFVDQCLRCQALLAPVDQPLRPGGATIAQVAEAPEPGGKALLERLPALLQYAVQPNVLYTVLGLAVINSVLYWAVKYNISFGLRLLAFCMARGLEAAVYFHVVHTTAYGEDRFEPPDATHLADELFAPLGRYAVATSPILLAFLWYGHSVHDSLLTGLIAMYVDPAVILDHPGPMLLFAFGLLLLPLLTCIAAVGGTAINVLNPALWVRSLRIMGSTYGVAVLMFYGVLAFEALVFVPALLKVQANFSIPVVTTVVTIALSYLPMIVRGRVLGALCEPYFRDQPLE